MSCLQDDVLIGSDVGSRIFDALSSGIMKKRI